MTSPRINLPVSKLEDEIERLQTRNDRLALLVRLIDSHVDLSARYDILEVWTSNGEESEEWPCTYTNGIPDLTDDQWDRLAKLEKGGEA